MRIIALFGPTGVGKTAVAVALAELLRARGEDPVAVSADALQVYAGLEILTGVASPAERARLEHRLVSFLPIDATLQRRPVRRARARRDRRAARRRAAADRRRRHRPVPARGADRARPAPAAAGGRARALDRRARAHAAPRRCTRARARARRGPPRAIEPNDRSAIVRALELLDAGELEPPDGPSQLWSERAAPPDAARRADDGARRAVRAIDARVEAMIAAGAREEVRRAHAAGASETARKALGLRGAARRRRRAR